MNTSFPAEPVREVLSELKAKTADIASVSPDWRRVLTVREHEGALDPSRMVVIGDRGAGKSFWTGALLDTEGRKRLSTVYPRLHLDALIVELGFGGDEFTSSHPTSHELSHLIRRGFTSEAIWRAVILSLAPAEVRPKEVSSGTWDERVQWVADDPAQRRDYFRVVDNFLQSTGKHLLVIFDALDTLSSNWEDISNLMRGLLQVGLFLRPARNLQMKMFIRPDMVDDPQLWAVGDSSKLRNDEVILAWTRRDLHALLIQYLTNHDKTRKLVQTYTREILQKELVYEADRYEVPAELLSDEKAQQQFFTLVAGRFMGKSATKGRTYTWVPNHLANAKGHAAPRSFLLALSVAAEKSQGKSPALEVEGIKEGVRQASQSRMLELREDYQWIDAVFRPLRDMQVPVERKEIIQRWRKGKIVALINKKAKADKSGRYLPPPRIASQIDDTASHDALIETLDHLGIIEVIGDGRVNMPDLFRLAAGVKRMGGVKLRP